MKAGSCHCGNVKFEIQTKDEIKKVISCNCSICRRKGTLLFFVPIDQFKLVSGQESLSDYQFGKKVIHHYFCQNCGVTSFSAGSNPDGTEMRAVNVRCLDDVELESLEIQHFDGKNYR